MRVFARFAADVCEDDEKAEPPPENRLGSSLGVTLQGLGLGVPDR